MTIEADPRETTGGYHPPESAEAHEWWALAIKFAAALFLSATACAAIGLSSATTAIIAASFLVASPPVAAIRTTFYRVVAMIVGVALGIAGAMWGLSNGSQIPPLYYLGFGAVAGIMASKKVELTYTAAIGAVVASTGATGSEPLLVVAVETCVQLLIEVVREI